MSGGQGGHRELEEGELERILAAHAEWLASDGKVGERADLQRANLQLANLQGENLWKANLQGADLHQADLRGADLFMANAAGAHFLRAQLDNARLEETDFSGADLNEVKLSGANLKGAVLTDTVLRLAVLDAATAEKSEWSNGYVRELRDRGATLATDLADQVDGGGRGAGSAGEYQPYPVDDVEKLEKLTRARAKDRGTAAEQQQRQVEIDGLVATLKRSPSQGDVVAGCKLVHILGKGNYGVVWQATHEQTAEQRAVKIFDSDQAGPGHVAVSLPPRRSGYETSERDCGPPGFDRQAVR